jgi:transposase
MSETTTSFVGLDVHKDSTAIAQAEAGREDPRFIGTVGPEIPQLLKALARLARPEHLLVTYEAGPCGYGLARQLHEHGYRCEVIAPNKMPRPKGERLKTDRRDALTLARLARSGDLVKVFIPDERDEAMRDLTRAREDAVRARHKARQQLNALLLRHGYRYTGANRWTVAHERYLADLKFPHPAQYTAFAEYLQAVHEADARITRLTEALREQTEHWRLKPLVRALMSLRGIDFVAAVTLVAEVGDFRRFARPREVMSFLGLVPSEFSSGEHRRQGEITKAGNGHARRMLVEAAWNYRFPARISRLLLTRQEGQSKLIRDIAWRAQLRLTRRFARLRSRQLHQNKICVAVARELAGFIWDIARQVSPQDPCTSSAPTAANPGKTKTTGTRAESAPRRPAANAATAASALSSEPLQPVKGALRRAGARP